MLSVEYIEPIFVLLIEIAHHLLNTFGETMPEDASTVQKLENRNELIEKETRYILKAISELQNSIPGNFLADGRNQKENYDEHFNCIRNCGPDESCSAATLKNDSEDGVYLLKGPKSISNPFYVYCHHENKSETAWTIIQRRQDGSVNFTRNWLDYKLGFGDLNGEYWIGLERIHQITNSQPHELLIVLNDFKLGKRYAKYSEFVVGNEDEGYKLTVKGYSGDAPDSFLEHSSMKFSTIDRDNDLVDRSCANDWKGGWWYKNCYLSNLNGVYDSSYTTKLDGINWVKWTEYISLQKVFMAIRPIEV